MIILPGCSRGGKSVFRDFQGDYSIKTLSLHSSSSGEDLWHFKGKDILIEGNDISGKHCDVEFRLASGRSRVTGDSGTLTMDVSMILSGNVKYQDGDHLLMCSRLYYDIPGDKILVPGDFKFIIIEEGRTIEGHYLTSENNFINIYIERIDKMSLEVDNSELFR